MREKRAYENVLERGEGVFGLMKNFPDYITDDELAGLAPMVNPDLRSTLVALLAYPDFRTAGIKWAKGLNVYLTGVLDAAREVDGKKLVGIPFTMPPEVIYCFKSLWPMLTEVVALIALAGLDGQMESYWDQAMALGVPDSLCAANALAIGSFINPGLRPHVVVNNTIGSCNPNATAHAFLANYVGIPQLAWEKPAENSPKARDVWYERLKVLMRQLEELSGEKLDEGRMRYVLENCEKAWELWWELGELKKLKPCPIPNVFNMCADATRLALWGTEEGVELMQIIVDAAKARAKNGTFTAPEVARVWWSYIYYYTDFYGMWNWFEDRGVTFLGQIISLYYQPEWDVSSMDSMMRVLSETAFDYTMTRQMGSGMTSDQWLDDTEQCMRDVDADAAIYCGYHACKHASGGSAYFRREIGKRLKVPVLNLQGDTFDKRMSPASYWQEEIVNFLNSVVLKGDKKLVT